MGLGLSRLKRRKGHYRNDSNICTGTAEWGQRTFPDWAWAALSCLYSLVSEKYETDLYSWIKYLSAVCTLHGDYQYLRVRSI